MFFLNLQVIWECKARLLPTTRRSDRPVCPVRWRVPALGRVHRAAQLACQCLHLGPLRVSILQLTANEAATSSSNSGYHLGPVHLPPIIWILRWTLRIPTTAEGQWTPAILAHLWPDRDPLTSRPVWVTSCLLANLNLVRFFSICYYFLSQTKIVFQFQIDGVSFGRQLQSFAQQKQQHGGPQPNKQQQQQNEPNLMPVPSPQQIQYLNAFEAQELTIQKQPNTSLRDTDILSPS